MYHHVSRPLTHIALLLGLAGQLAAQDFFPQQQQPPQTQATQQQPQQQQQQQQQVQQLPTPPQQGQQQPPMEGRRQLPPGFSYDQARLWGDKVVYTHYVGAFVIDPTGWFTKTHAIFRSQPLALDGTPLGPLMAYDHEVINLGLFPSPFCHGHWGYLCFVNWPTHPQAQQLPAFLFFEAGPYYHCYNVYSYRWYAQHWRCIGSFVTAPLGTP
jgi:hypothetical protein